MTQIPLTTLASFTAYALASGKTGPNSIDPTTEGLTYTPLKVNQAIYRGIEFIMIRYVDNFATQYQITYTPPVLDDDGNVVTAGKIEGPAEVISALEQAANIASSLELANPDVFTITHAPGSGQEVKKAGATELYQSRVASTDTNIVQSKQTIDNRLHYLLDRFLRVDAVAGGEQPGSICDIFSVS